MTAPAANHKIYPQDYRLVEKHWIDPATWPGWLVIAVLLALVIIAGSVAR